MKLKFFSEQTLPKASIRGTSTPRIGLGKNGAIIINKTAAEKVGITEKSKISLAQDEEDSACWYLFLDPQNGFKISGKKYKEEISDYQMNHRSLQQQICASLKLDPDKSHGFYIAGEATTMQGSKTKYWGLLEKPKV